MGCQGGAAGQMHPAGATTRCLNTVNGRHHAPAHPNPSLGRDPLLREAKFGRGRTSPVKGCY